MSPDPLFFAETVHKLLKQITLPKESPSEGASSAEKAKTSRRQEGQSLADQRKSQEMDHAEREMIQREKYASKVYLLVIGWICVIFALLVLQGFRERFGYQPLSDKVLLALITSTTVDIIATLILVLKYLFRTTKPNAPKPDKAR